MGDAPLAMPSAVASGQRHDRNRQAGQHFPRYTFDAWPSRQTMISFGVNACQHWRDSGLVMIGIIPRRSPICRTAVCLRAVLNQIPTSPSTRQHDYPLNPVPRIKSNDGSERTAACASDRDAARAELDHLPADANLTAAIDIEEQRRRPPDLLAL